MAVTFQKIADFQRDQIITGFFLVKNLTLKTSPKNNRQYADYQLADQITKGLQEIHPDLARAIRVKTGRYNQHISTGCILIEAGHNENTLEQVLNAMPYLAKVLAQVMGK